MMGVSRRFFVINMGIIIFNALFGIMTYVSILNFKSPIRERYVQLPEDTFINDQQLPDDVPDSTMSSNDSSWGDTVGGGGGGGGGGGCQNHTERKSPTLDHNRGIFDKSRQFKYHPYAVSGDKWGEVSESWNICLSTQTSVELLFWVPKQAETWEGPISVSLFTPDVDYTIAVKMIRYLQKCTPDLMRKVTFHMVYPRSLPPVYTQTDDEQQMEYDCDQIEAVNQELVKQIRTESLAAIMKKTAYPQNLLRNLARQGCHNEYSFTPDVDMLSIPGMSKQLNEFTTRTEVQECEKCAFIIPTYEIHTRITTNPVNKSELRALLKKRRAQRFHIKAFSPNQANSMLQKWEKRATQPSLDILYNITTWRNYWEPVYIAKSSVPHYDERFVGYGFTRNSQVYEMHVADYTWHMLNNLFLCHRGFQLSKRRNSIRRGQISKNSKKYAVFRKEIYARYGKKEADYEPKKTIYRKRVKPEDKQDKKEENANDDAAKEEMNPLEEVKKENSENDIQAVDKIDEKPVEQIDEKAVDKIDEKAENKIDEKAESLNEEQKQNDKGDIKEANNNTDNSNARKRMRNRRSISKRKRI